MSQPSPTHLEEDTLESLDYNYSGLKGVSKEVKMEVSEKILVIKTDNSSVFKEEEEMTEENISEVQEDSEKEEEDEVDDDNVAKGGVAEMLTADQVATELERLMEELAEEGERVIMWRRSRGPDGGGGGGGGWHRVAVRENGHGTLISKGW